MERKYLLAVKELTTELERNGLHSPLIMQAVEKLDTYRREKVLQIANPKRRAQSIGAGILLQLGLQEYYVCEPSGMSHRGAQCETGKEDVQDDAWIIQKLSIQQILSRLNSPTEVTYRYGEKGKPYFAEIPLYFSISHCEDYVFCVFSPQEIGADIQCKKTVDEESMLRRFFAPKDKAVWESCVTAEEKRDFFYRLWARKEAYSKLTGRGIAETIAVDTDSPPVSFEEYEVENNYRIAICKQKLGYKIEK